MYIRMLVIQIAAITLASDSAIIIARFCPSKITAGIAKTTNTTQTTINRGVDCWIGGNHGNHRKDENHQNLGCTT